MHAQLQKVPVTLYVSLRSSYEMGMGRGGPLNAWQQCQQSCLDVVGQAPGCASLTDFGLAFLDTSGRPGETSKGVWMTPPSIHAM